MFSGAAAFNQPLEAWAVDQVTSMNRMFRGAAAFNQPLEAWSVDQVTDMGSMFSGATAFDQSLEAWSGDQVTQARSSVPAALKKAGGGESCEDLREQAANFFAGLVNQPKASSKSRTKKASGKAAGGKPDGDMFAKLAAKKKPK
jgi:hypothetical protein